MIVHVELSMMSDCIVCWTPWRYMVNMFGVVWCLVLWLWLVFSVMWSGLLMTSAISCPLWSSMYECHKVELAFTSPVRTVCVMFVMCCMQCCCCLPSTMTLAIGGSPIFPLVVYQPASPSILPAVDSIRRGLSINPGMTMWCVRGCS